MKRLFLIIIFQLCRASFASPVDVYDSFESHSLSPIWDTTKFVQGAVQIQSRIVHSGQSAAQITVHKGDCFEPGNSNRMATERDELLEAKSLESRAGEAVSYSFSIFIPADFPVVPTRLVLAQWKQRCAGRTCTPDNPIIALRYVNGELSVTRHAKAGKVILFATREDVRNKWMVFEFQIRYSLRADGFVKSWMNGSQIVDYSGPVGYEGGGYSTPSRFYFKWGLYRDQFELPMTVFVDDYLKEPLFL